MAVVRHSHMGVYAVIVDEAGACLLTIRKMRGPYTGLLDLPGGSMEEGELLEETLRREVKEETGCTVEEFAQVGAFSTRYAYELEGAAHELRHVGILYECRIQGEPRVDGDGEDAGGCVWVPMDRLENVTPFVAMVVERIRGGS